MKKKIAIIGCGNIGYRHLQSLLKIINLIELWVVEKSQKKIENLKLQINKKKDYKDKLKFCNKVSQLPSKIYISIISTNSKERLKVLENITKYIKTKFIIFEKVLFPKIDNYFLAKKILKKKRIKSWVHMPLPDFPFFKFIINKLRKEKKFKIIIKGPEGNLGCNSIHYLGIFKNIINKSQFSVDTSKLGKLIIKSKRKGYIEFIGKIIFSTLDKKKFLFIDYSDKRKKNYFRSEIFFKNFKIIYNEVSGQCKIFNYKNKLLIKEKIFKVPYVSNTTQQYVKQIIKSNNCKLPSFDNAAILHKKLIISLQSHLNQNSKRNYNSCPIT